FTPLTSGPIYYTFGHYTVPRAAQLSWFFPQYLPSLSPPVPHSSKLDSRKQAQACVLLAFGHSETVVARVVGTTPETISQLAAHDPEFTQQVQNARRTALA